MFDTLLAPTEPEVDLVTVWDVLAGRVDPGPDAIAALAAVNPAHLDAGTRAEIVSAWEAQASWLEARKLSALHAMSCPVPVVDPDDPADAGFRVVPERVTVEEARLALGCSPTWVEYRMGLARDLATRLPKTRELLEAGRISAYAAGIAATESQRLSVAECAEFEQRLYPRGESQTPTRFRRSARLVAAGLHPEDLETAHTWAKQGTDVARWVEEHGMASLRVHAPAPVIGELWDAVNTEAWAQAGAAKRLGEEWVPIGERRVQVFTRWARTGNTQLAALGVNPDERDGCDVSAVLAEQVSDGVDLAAVSEPATEEQLKHLQHLEALAALAKATPEPAKGSAPGPVNALGLPNGPPPQVQVGVLIDLDILLGARDGPAVLEGYGTIPASMARQLAAEGSWRRVLLEPVEGWLLDYGRTRYQPSAKLRDHLLGLGQDCRAPYCNTRPRQTDHGTDWALGGATSAENLNGLCVHSHRLKTRDGFSVTNEPDGSMTWTTPAGSSYTKPPDDLRIVNHGAKPAAPSTS